MKTTTFAAALLASTAVAQPHGRHQHHHHAKRELVIEWETVYETATVIVDESGTRTLLPSQAETTAIAGNFHEQPTYTPPVVESPTTYEALPPPSTTAQAAPTTTVASEPQPTTYQTSPVVAPTTTSQAPPVDTYTPPVETYSPPATTTSAAPEPTATAPSTGGGAGENTGKVTYYTVGSGACGYDDSGHDEDKNIVAMPAGYWESISHLTSYGVNQPAHPLCDKTITIYANGNSIKATVRDKCPGCDGMNIDVTSKAFKDLFGSTDGGKLPCTWTLDEPL